MAGRGEAGSLRIGFVGSATLELLPRVIEAFSEHYPKVRLDSFEGTNGELLRGVAEEALHLAFVRAPTATPPGVQLQIVEKDVFCIALPARHRLMQRKSIRMQELADESFVGYSPSRGSTLHAAMMRLCEQSGLTAIPLEVEVRRDGRR